MIATRQVYTVRRPRVSPSRQHRNPNGRQNACCGHLGLQFPANRESYRESLANPALGNISASIRLGISMGSGKIPYAIKQGILGDTLGRIRERSLETGHGRAS
jgi:hypothetical protein